MKRYVVIEEFKDLQDNDHLYAKGDAYPHDDKVPTKARIKQLSTSKNRRGTPLIELVEDDY